jgi:DNA-binding NarL/FixJ family response regulator
MPQIRVLIADDHSLVRAGLRTLIQAQPDMELVGEAGDYAQTRRQVATLQPDILTLDLTMPNGKGLGEIQEIHRLAPSTRVIVLTMHDDPAYLRTALALGAAGYVVKSAADTELVTAIRAVFRGRTFVDAQHAMDLEPSTTTGTAGNATAGPSPLQRLSAREREVLTLVAQGHTNQSIADRMDLSVKTIESYRARMMEKLQLDNRADLTRFAVECGLLASGPKQQPS